jgi:hypothetical protein
MCDRFGSEDDNLLRAGNFGLATTVAKHLFHFDLVPEVNRRRRGWRLRALGEILISRQVR